MLSRVLHALYAGAATRAGMRLAVPGVDVYARHQGKGQVPTRGRVRKVEDSHCADEGDADSVADRATVWRAAQTSKRSILKYLQKGSKTQDPGRSAFECWPFVTGAG